MNHVDFAIRLIRLDRHDVGLREACTLFTLGGGSTMEQIGKALGVPPIVAKSRMYVLRAKGLAEDVVRNDRPTRYRPTAKGARIIRETLNIKL